MAAVGSAISVNSVYLRGYVHIGYWTSRLEHRSIAWEFIDKLLFLVEI